MFSRRTIQAIIDAVGGLLPAEQLASLVGRLNRPDRVAIEATWELLWIYSLGKCGQVEHEPHLPDAESFPDIHFQSPELEFIADVTAVSDVNYEKENPVEDLRAALDKLYAKYAPGGGFAVKIDARHEGPYRDNKVKLLLPDRGQLPAFIRQNFGPFVRAVGAAPHKTALHQAAVTGGGVVQIDYNPQRKPYNHGPGHLSFDVPYSLTRNPVFNALKGKKRQLAKAAYAGLQGVILCDGDCSALTQRIQSPDVYKLDQIVREFLRENTSIGFVLTVGVTAEAKGFGSPRWSHCLKPSLFVQPGLDPKRVQSLTSVLNAAFACIPQVKRTPLNTRYHLARGSPPPPSVDAFGAWSFSLGNSMQTSEITISARTLTALLGGDISLEKFRAAHQIASNNGSPPLEPLQRMLKDGRQLISIRLEPLPGEDDDQIMMCFGPPDPAKVKFRIPDRQSSM